MTDDRKPTPLRDSGPAVNEEAYWRQEGAGVFTLLLGNRQAATINLEHNIAIVTGKGTPERLAVPDSRSVFDAVEAHLGVPRIEDCLGLDGRPALALRHQAEDRATSFGRQVPPSREPRHHLTSAWQWLDQGMHDRTLSLTGEQAHGHVREALRSHEIHGRWTREGRRRVDEALRALDGPGTEGQSYGEQQAGVDCAKARACLEDREAGHGFEQALKTAARQEAGRGPDHEADRER